MAVAAHDRHAVLTGTRGNPQVVRRNRRACCFEFQANGGIVTGSFASDFQDEAAVQQSL